jgi:hypothetical protein
MPGCRRLPHGTDGVFASIVLIVLGVRPSTINKAAGSTPPPRAQAVQQALEHQKCSHSSAGAREGKGTSTAASSPAMARYELQAHNALSVT